MSKLTILRCGRCAFQFAANSDSIEELTSLRCPRCQRAIPVPDEDDDDRQFDEGADDDDVDEDDADDADEDDDLDSTVENPRRRRYG